MFRWKDQDAKEQLRISTGEGKQCPRFPDLFMKTKKEYAAMQYDRTVLAYHGCDIKTARQLLEGEPFKQSQNDYDWLGSGIYFWEFGSDRAWKFAELQAKRKDKKVDEPAIVGAIIQLGDCFDLLDTRFTKELKEFYPKYFPILQAGGATLPKNEGKTPDKKLRKLDCAVINAYLRVMEDTGQPFDTVRCGFLEGNPVYDGAMIFEETHIQIAVRNPACIIGVFQPSSFKA